jgi:hypothetical protein
VVISFDPKCSPWVRHRRKILGLENRTKRSKVVVVLRGKSSKLLVTHNCYLHRKRLNVVMLHKMRSKVLRYMMSSNVVMPHRMRSKVMLAHNCYLHKMTSNVVLLRMKRSKVVSYRMKSNVVVSRKKRSKVC